VQEEFRQAEEGLAQTSMDKVLRKGGEGESLTERTLVFLKPEAILRGVEHVISGPILAMVVEGPNAVSIVRNMIGKTSPLEAQPGTIRGDFALDVQKNIVHASDSLENARKEIEILFNPDEILNYRKPTEAQSLL